MRALPAMNLDLPSVEGRTRRACGADRRRHSRKTTMRARSWATIRSLPTGLVEYVGQSIFAVAADDTIDEAPCGRRPCGDRLRTCRLSWTIDQAMEAGSFILPDPSNGAGRRQRPRSKVPQRTAAGRSGSAARTISIWKARSRSPYPGEDGDVHVTARPSTRAKCSTTSPRCWVCASPCRHGRERDAWAAASAARKASPR